jgi:hypothetical protein
MINTLQMLPVSKYFSILQRCDKDKSSLSKEYDVEDLPVSHILEDPRLNNATHTNANGQSHVTDYASLVHRDKFQC